MKLLTNKTPTPTEKAAIDTISIIIVVIEQVGNSTNRSVVGLGSRAVTIDTINSSQARPSITPVDETNNSSPNNHETEKEHQFMRQKEAN